MEQRGVAGGLLKAATVLRSKAQDDWADRAPAANAEVSSERRLSRIDHFDEAAEALDDLACDIIAETLAPVLGYLPCGQPIWGGGAAMEGMPTSVCLIPAGIEHDHG
jgi:hypothetical protein